MPVPPPRQPLLALCCAALLAAAAAAAGAPAGEAARLAEGNALKDTIHRLPAKEAARRFAALTARGTPPPRQDAIDHFVVLCKPAPPGSSMFAGCGCRVAWLAARLTVLRAVLRAVQIWRTRRSRGSSAAWICLARTESRRTAW